MNMAKKRFQELMVLFSKGWVNLSESSRDTGFPYVSAHRGYQKFQSFTQVEHNKPVGRPPKIDLPI